MEGSLFEPETSSEATNLEEEKDGQIFRDQWMDYFRLQGDKTECSLLTQILYKSEREVQSSRLD